MAGQTEAALPEFYRGLLDGYYVELVVDWLPDKRVEGEIWTAAHKIMPADLGFVFAKVRGDNNLDGQLELEIVGDEVSERRGAGQAKRLGIASLQKNLSGDYIEWTGEYRPAAGDAVPMTMYRERRNSPPAENQADGTGALDVPSGKQGSPDTGACEEGVCTPVRMEVCIDTKHGKEAREYFQWLKFPLELPFHSPAGDNYPGEFSCNGEPGLLEVDGFSETYWEQELKSLPFVTSVRRAGKPGGRDSGVIEMPISSFFSGAVPDDEEAVKKITAFFNDYFSKAVAAGSITLSMKERTQFNYTIDIAGTSSALASRKPGFRERHRLSIMMSQPYPYDYPEKFAVYVSLPVAQSAALGHGELPLPDAYSDIEDGSVSAFLQKIVSALAYRYRAAVWTP